MIGGRKRDRCNVQRCELGETKAGVPWKGGNPFHGGKSEKWEREQHVGFARGATVWGSPGSHWKTTFPFPEDIWKRTDCLSKVRRPTGHH